MSQLRSTGRRPSVDLDALRGILGRWFDSDGPSVEAIASEKGLCAASVRKYLRLALGSLPRGRAAVGPREARNIDTLVNGVPTDALLGEGRVELLLRKFAGGMSRTALATEFGISRDRVSKLVAEHATAA
jgi:predicted transcriptional regulator